MRSLKQGQARGVRGTLALALMVGGGVLVACHKDVPPPKPVEDHGRPETRSIEGINAVGYNGTAVRQKLDKALDANDATNKQMDDAASQ